MGLFLLFLVCFGWEVFNKSKIDWSLKTPNFLEVLKFAVGISLMFQGGKFFYDQLILWQAAGISGLVCVRIIEYSIIMCIFEFICAQLYKIFKKIPIIFDPTLPSVENPSIFRWASIFVAALACNSVYFFFPLICIFRLVFASKI